MDNAWNELSFDFEPAVEAALPASANANAGDFRFRTQVCRHWLRGLCMKGDSCEFLHKMDRNRMPLCRWRTDCQVEGCAFRHEEEQEAPECAMYQQGFCRAGPHCRFRHVKLAREDCPEFADFSLVNPLNFSTGGAGGGRANGAGGGFSVSFGGGGFGGNRGGGRVGGMGERNSGGGGDYVPGDTRKTIMCKNWLKTKDCPYKDNCNYAHGEEELRAAISSGGGGSFGSRPQRFGFGSGEKDPFTDPDIEKAVPIKAGDKARFFVLKSLNHDNLAVSAVQKKWYCRRNNILSYNKAFEQQSPLKGKVVFFFSVIGSDHFQGCAEMRSRIPDLGPRVNSEAAVEFSLEWLRLVELRFAMASQINNPLNENIRVNRSRDGQELEYEAGRKLLKLIWSQPEISLPDHIVETAGNSDFSGVSINSHPGVHVPFNGKNNGNAGGNGAGGGGPGPGPGRGRGTAAGIVAGVGGVGAGSLSVAPAAPPIGPPGFLFEIESQHFDECVGKLLFGLPRRLPPGAHDVIKPGNTLFLWDPGNGLLLGIFRAVSGLTEYLDRTAWTARPGLESPLPWQVRVAVDVEAPPIKLGDPVLHDVFHGGVIKPGALTPQQADLLASAMVYRDPPAPKPLAAGQPPVPGGGFNGVSGDPGRSAMRKRQGVF